MYEIVLKNGYVNWLCWMNWIIIYCFCKLWLMKNLDCLIYICELDLLVNFMDSEFLKKKKFCLGFWIRCLIKLDILNVIWLIVIVVYCLDYGFIFCLNNGFCFGLDYGFFLLVINRRVLLFLIFVCFNLMLWGKNRFLWFLSFYICCVWSDDLLMRIIVVVCS